MQQILSIFAQKMVNSGHSLSSVQYILVHGVIKYSELLKLSELSEDDIKHQPLYRSKQYNSYNRKLHKLLQKSGWFSESEIVMKTKWRHIVPKGWSGCKPLQYNVPGMKYTTIMQVPSTKDSRLLKMLAKAEPRLAKISKYQVKYVEKSGKQLTKYFNKEPVSLKCFREDCHVCRNSNSEKPSLCQVKNVVYMGVCVPCEIERASMTKDLTNKKIKGVYIGETARTLAERAKEHRAAYNRLESKSFMFKHWSSEHPNLDHPPEFKFSVVKTHKEPMGRLIHEAIKIFENATLNSKSEWGGGTSYPDYALKYLKKR